MDKDDKIENFKEVLGVEDDSIAKKYLEKAKWDENQAILLFLEEHPDNGDDIINNNKNLNNQNAYGYKELKITENLFSKEIFKQNEQYSFNDLAKYLAEKFYVSKDFKDFLSRLKKGAGLIMLLTVGKMPEVRNNMIRAANTPLCLDILKDATIFPITRESKVGEELIKQLNPKEYPVYIFCKYKNSQIITVNGTIENKFRMENVINNLLDCFPNNDVKQSIYQSIKSSIKNIGNQNEGQNDDFSGNKNEVNNMVNKLQKDIRISSTLFRIQQARAEAKNKEKKEEENKVQNPIQEQVEPDDDNPFNPQRPLNIPKKDNEPKNRFRDFYDDEDSTVIMKNNLKAQVEEKNDDPLNLPTVKEFKIECLLPKEPDENDPNACTITFRYPYGEKQKIRRFNKNDKIEVLYTYVKSLGGEIYSKPDFNTFELIYGYPPENFEKKRNSTLNEEGLFPASLINIVEK